MIECHSIDRVARSAVESVETRREVEGQLDFEHGEACSTAVARFVPFVFRIAGGSHPVRTEDAYGDPGRNETEAQTS
jgi:hypothetical protein